MAKLWRIFIPLMVAGIWFGSCKPIAEEVANPVEILLPYERLEKLDINKFKEPSGLVFHAARGTLFVIGDEGRIAEFRPDGRLLKEAKLDKKDFEGITYDPATGLLYVVDEDRAEIMEVDPNNFGQSRLVRIEPLFEDVAVLSAEKNKVEGITFAPDETHPEGGTFYLSNKNPEAEDETGSIIFEVEAPLTSGLNLLLTAKVVNRFPVEVPDISDLLYDPESDHLFFISDRTNTFFEITRLGQILRAYALPGDDQEGLAIDYRDFLYIAQDSGGVLKFRKIDAPDTLKK